MVKRNVIHVDIPSSNSEETGKFYHELFGWEITPLPSMNFTVWETEGSRGGFVAIGDNVKVGDVQIYIASENIAADLEKAKMLGAEILQNETEIPGKGWYGFFKDPTGNKIGLFKRNLDE